MSKRDVQLLIEDMIEAAAKIKRYTDGLNFVDFIRDEKTIDAVARNFEIIGEAANRVDPAFRSLHSQIEWNRIRGFRNRLIHEYFGIDYSIVWSIIESDLEQLIVKLESILYSN